MEEQFVVGVLALRCPMEVEGMDAVHLPGHAFHLGPTMIVVTIVEIVVITHEIAHGVAAAGNIYYVISIVIWYGIFMGRSCLICLFTSFILFIYIYLMTMQVKCVTPVM